MSNDHKHINLHKAGSPHNYHPDKLPAHKERVSNAFEQIRVLAEDDNNEILAIILSLITKYTFTLTQEEVRKYNAGEIEALDKTTPKFLDSIVEALHDIGQNIVRERIMYQQLLKKVKRDDEKED